MARSLDLTKQRRWLDLLQAWQRSGLSVRLFCTRRRLSQCGFYFWRRSLRQRGLLNPPSATSPANPSCAPRPLPGRNAPARTSASLPLPKATPPKATPPKAAPPHVTFSRAVAPRPTFCHANTSHAASPGGTSQMPVTSANSATAMPAFVSLVLSQSPLAATFELVLTNGRVLRIPPGFDPQSLAQLITLLERPSC